MNKRLNIVNQPGTFLAKELEERKISPVKFALCLIISIIS